MRAAAYQTRCSAEVDEDGQRQGDEGDKDQELCVRDDLKHERGSARDRELLIGSDADVYRMRVPGGAAEERVPGGIVLLRPQEAVAHVAGDRIARFRLVSLDRHPIEE